MKVINNGENEICNDNNVISVMKILMKMANGVINNVISEIMIMT